MRIFTNCKESVREVERDIFEMGIEIHGTTMQDKKAKDPKQFWTLELSPCTFQITQAHKDPEEFIKYLFPNNWEGIKKWADAEMKERVGGAPLNPGTAWKLRKDMWKEYLHNGYFGYTYSERITPQLNRIIEELKKRPATRQAIINIHNNLIDINHLGGGARIPCSIIYHLLIRNNKLDIIYIMRSCDFLQHFAVDCYMAIKLQIYIANKLKIPTGRFTYFSSSLHAFYSNMEERGIF